MFKNFAFIAETHVVDLPACGCCRLLGDAIVGLCRN